MKREDKAINDIPDFSLSADERPDRRRSTGVPPKKPGKPAPENNSPKGGSGAMVWLLLVLILVLAGGGIWQFQLMQKELMATRAELKSAQESLQQVTGEVSATGENLDQSGSALRSELKVVNSEIRKLWDVANKRNKKWIVINKDNVVKATRIAEGAAGDAEKANKSITGIKSQVREMDQLMKAISTEQVAAQSEATASMETLRKQMADIQALMEDQKKLMAELNKKVENQQQAVKSVDAFRQQVNRKIQQLEGTVRDFTQPPQEGLGLQ